VNIKAGIPHLGKWIESNNKTASWVIAEGFIKYGWLPTQIQQSNTKVATILKRYLQSHDFQEIFNNSKGSNNFNQETSTIIHTMESAAYSTPLLTYTAANKRLRDLTDPTTARLLSHAILTVDDFGFEDI
jgi:hypothetical protein